MTKFKVYELIVEDNTFPQSVIPDPVKSPNQLRAEIIEKSKGFVESCKTNVTGVATNGSNKGQRKTWQDVYSSMSKGGRVTACYAEFIVVEKKRKVVALLKGVDSNKVYEVGEAVCHTNNVFNEHIGKAIALGRALGLDVSEFEQVVQPTLAIGQFVRDYPWNKTHEVKILKRGALGGSGYIDENDIWHFDEDCTIINDTNAIYSEVSE